MNELNSVRTLGDIRLLYFKYKDTPYFSLAVVCIVGLIAILLLWKAVLPQVGSWFSLQEEVKKTNENISLLKANQTILAGLNDSQLEDQFAVATTALPYAKDYAGIISSIDDATILAGVRRDDYSLQIGDLSTKSAQLASETSLPVKISLKGTVGQMQHFLHDINKKLPLSEVVTVSFGNDGATIGLIYFYKFLPDNLQILYTRPVKTLNQPQITLLKTLGTWKQQSLMEIPTTPEIPQASGSAVTGSDL
ncbi:MAG: type 4a pilus biogenesis protein PilO [Patescibacteria group bacterium]